MAHGHLEGLRLQIAQIIHFRAAQYLHSFRMHKIEVAHQGQRRFLDDVVGQRICRPGISRKQADRFGADAGLEE